MISIAAAIGGLLLIGSILWDAFETIVLPRRVSVQIRLSRLFLRVTSRSWLAIGKRIRNHRQREDFLGIYGPLALILLLGAWAVGLILGFSLLQWANGTQLKVPAGSPDYATDLYLSGGGLFAAPPGDVNPSNGLARLILTTENGLGLGFLALIIGYLPVLYQGFSTRETRISMLDEWAGSPATAVELLRRLGRERDLQSVNPFLTDWEAWAAELLESHLSYPVLAFFRSQHENQSWLGALTMILDTCALVLVGIDDIRPAVARRTFAMARHALVDLSQVFDAAPRTPSPERLSPDDLAALRKELDAVGVRLYAGDDAVERLNELRRLYEPFAHSLAETLVFPLPSWRPAPDVRDNWQTTAFESPDDAHF